MTSPADLQRDREALAATHKILGNTRFGRLSVEQRKELVALFNSGVSEKLLFRHYFEIVFPEKIALMATETV